MKKVLFAVLMAIAVSATAGEYMDLSAGVSKNSVSEQRSGYGIAAYGMSFAGFDLEGRVIGARTNDTNINGNAGEARLRYTLPLGDFRLWARGTLGESFPNAANRFGYWAAEPGVGYMLTKDIRLDGSVRRTESFRSNVNVDQVTWVGGASYQLDKSDAVGVRFYKTHGDVRSNALEVGYTRSF